MSRDAADFLLDIEESCVRIIDYTRGLGQDEVFADKMRFDGILHNFYVIGEAVKNFPYGLREQHTDIPWKETDAGGLNDVCFGVQ